MGSMIQAVVEKTLDPVQFLVDRLTLENSEAMSCQDENGLSLWRRRKLLEVFHQMDADKSGKVDFQDGRFVSKHAGRCSATRSSRASSGISTRAWTTKSTSSSL